MKFMLKTKVGGLDTSGSGVKFTVEPAAGGEQSVPNSSHWPTS